MKTTMNKAFHSCKLFITSGMLVFLILFSTKRAYAGENMEYPYLIKVNRYYNTITVYEMDEDGEYSKPVKAIVCSVGKKGTPTRLGTFQTQEKIRWKWLMGKVYGQYSTRINGGMLFHSVYYYKIGNPSTLSVKNYNKLGTAASHGCVRITVADAKWIYDNCPVGTTVIIYDDKSSPGPLGKPEACKITNTSVRWDPTDPDEKNPYKNKKPSISGVKNLTVSWGKEANTLKGIKAKSSTGSDITKKVKVKGKINNYKAGEYEITYSVTDPLGRTKEKAATVTVLESAEEPVFKGVSDHIVKGDTDITREYVLADVKAYCQNVRLSNDLIEVFIKKTKDNEYQVTYRTDIGEKVSATAYANYIIDSEAPVFTGVSDRTLEPGQVPDITYALSGVTVTDDYTQMDQNDITVAIEKISDNNDALVQGDEIPGSSKAAETGTNAETGTTAETDTNEENKTLPEEGISYLVTYSAADEAGNMAEITAKFKY